MANGESFAIFAVRVEVFCSQKINQTMNLSALVVSFLLTYMVVVTISLASGSATVWTKSAPDAVAILSLPPDTAEAPGGDLLPLPGLFDVTDYGAVADGKTESSLAFMAAWEDACAYPGSSIFYIPQGTFFVGAASFTGPCYGYLSPKVVIFGTLMAPTSLEAFDGGDWIQFKSLRWLNLTGGMGPAVLDAQGAEAWADSSCRRDFSCNTLPTSLKFSNISYGSVNNITLVNSKGFHVGLHGCDNIHLSGFNIRAPWNSPNTDGIHISQSTNINITTATIGVGDDCISIGPGSINVSVSNIRCGPGHGISVGSLGRYPEEKDVVGIRVQKCLINGTANGVRVKTWAGDFASNASGLTFEDIVMVNVSNPIIIDQEYCPTHSCARNKASSVQLSDITIKNITGIYNSQFAVNLLCSSSKPCDNLQLSNINLTTTEPDPKQIGHFSFKGAINGLQIVNSRF